MTPPTLEQNPVEAVVQEARQQWFRQRITALQEAVSYPSLLAAHGIRLRYQGARAEQMACPFHGIDAHPSARFFPATSEQPDGVWCWVCRKRRDVIDAWQTLNAYQGPFGGALRAMELQYGLSTPDMPKGVDMAWVEDQAKQQQAKQSVDQVLALCESRLRHSRTKFTCKDFLQTGHILDLLRARYEQGAIPFDQISVLLRQVLDVIARKERGCASST